MAVAQGGCIGSIFVDLHQDQPQWSVKVLGWSWAVILTFVKVLEPCLSLILFIPIARNSLIGCVTSKEV